MIGPEGRLPVRLAKIVFGNGFFAVGWVNQKSSNAKPPDAKQRRNNVRHSVVDAVREDAGRLHALRELRRRAVLEESGTVVLTSGI